MRECYRELQVAGAWPCAGSRAGVVIGGVDRGRSPPGSDAGLVVRRGDDWKQIWKNDAPAVRRQARLHEEDSRTSAVLHQGRVRTRGTRLGSARTPRPSRTPSTRYDRRRRRGVAPCRRTPRRGVDRCGEVASAERGRRPPTWATFTGGRARSSRQRGRHRAVGCLAGDEGAGGLDLAMLDAAPRVAVDVDDGRRCRSVDVRRGASPCAGCTVRLAVGRRPAPVHGAATLAAPRARRHGRRRMRTSSSGDALGHRRARAGERAAAPTQGRLRDPGDPRRLRAGRDDRRGDPADLRDLDLQAGRRRRAARRLRVQPLRQPDPHRPRGQHRGAGGGRARVRVRHRARRRGHPAPRRSAAPATTS